MSRMRLQIKAHRFTCASYNPFEYILVIIDAFSRWVELFPTNSPEVIHTDQGLAFHNGLVTELVRLCGIGQSFSTAYSSEENGIVDFEQLPLVQRIMNTVEKA